MNCKQCGEPLSEDSKFCAVCGKPVQFDPVFMPAAERPIITPAAAQPIEMPIAPQPVVMSGSAQTMAAPSSKKRGSRGKPILIAVIAVVVIAVLAIGAFFVMRTFSNSGTGNSYPPKTPLLVIYGEDEVQIYGGDKKPVTIDGLKDTYNYSMDGKEVALTVDADDAGLAALWYCDGKKAVDVAENVYNFNFSASGNKIAYLTDYDSATGVGDLYVYDVQTKKSELIIEEAYTEFALSPDGKSVAYASDVSTDEYGSVDSFTGYLSINGGKAEALSENQFAFALADDGKFVYYVEISVDSPESGALYVRHGKTDDKLGNADLYSGFCLNKDCSELLFVKGGSTYICVDGGDKQKVSSLALDTIIAPATTQYFSNYSKYLYAVILNTNSLADQLLAVGDADNGGTTLTYLKKDLAAEDIDELSDYYYMYNMSLSPNGKALYYINDSGKIVYYKNYRDLKADPVKIDSDADITNFVAMPDQTAVYFVDADQTLWVQRGTSDPEEVASRVETYPLCVSQDGKGIYFITDFEAADTSDEYAGGGVLNYVKNASKAEPDEIADNVYNVEVSDYSTVYYVYDHSDETAYSYIGEAFISQNGKDFESVMDNAIIG